jgi:hypothetical protein
MVSGFSVRAFEFAGGRVSNVPAVALGLDRVASTTFPEPVLLRSEPLILMRENTPDIGVEIRNVERKHGPEDDEYVAVEVAVPVVNPRSDTRDSYVDDDAIVGEIPVRNADTPCADERLNAAVVTVLDERVTAYYPREDAGTVEALVWEAATDGWRCESWDLDGEFAIEFDRRDQGEAILWEGEE